MTVGNWLKQSIATLQAAGINSARLDSLLLLEHVTNKERSTLQANQQAELTTDQQTKLRRLVAQRERRIPLAYLLGEREFFGLAMKVNEHTLIPRPETEVMVETAIAEIPNKSNVLEVGTGSGAIAVALSAHRSDLEITATDISAEAIAVATQNAKRHKADVRFIEADLLPDNHTVYSVILANLPYVPIDARRQPEITHEPDVALYSGQDGLDHYRRLIAELPNRIKDFSLIEASPTQYRPLQAIAKKHGLTIEPVSEYVYRLIK